MPFWLAPEPATYTDLVQYHYTLAIGNFGTSKSVYQPGGIPAAEQPGEAHLWVGEARRHTLAQILLLSFRT